MKIKLVIPIVEGSVVTNKYGVTFFQIKGKEELEMYHPRLGAEYFPYNNCEGEVICGAGTDGVYVRFNGMDANKYVGCPIKWCIPVEELRYEDCNA